MSTHTWPTLPAPEVPLRGSVGNKAGATCPVGSVVIAGTTYSAEQVSEYADVLRLAADDARRQGTRRQYGSVDAWPRLGDGAGLDLASSTAGWQGTWLTILDATLRDLLDEDPTELCLLAETEDETTVVRYDGLAVGIVQDVDGGHLLFEDGAEIALAEIIKLHIPG